MRLLFSTLAAGLVIGSAPSAQAKDWNKVVTYGPGNESCGAWTEAHLHNKVRADAQDFWVLGFVSAAQVMSTHDFQHTDADGMAAYISSYCATNPLELVAFAAVHLANTLTLPDKPAQ